jgi:hypothetical protein
MNRINRCKITKGLTTWRWKLVEGWIQGTKALNQADSLGQFGPLWQTRLDCSSWSFCCRKFAGSWPAGSSLLTICHDGEGLLNSCGLVSKTNSWYYASSAPVEQLVVGFGGLHTLRGIEVVCPQHANVGSVVIPSESLPNLGGSSAISAQTRVDTVGTVPAARKHECTRVQ